MTTISIILWILSGFLFCAIKLLDCLETPKWLIELLTKDIQLTLRAVWGATTVLALITTIVSATA